MPASGPISATQQTQVVDSSGSVIDTFTGSPSALAGTTLVSGVNLVTGTTADDLIQAPADTTYELMHLEWEWYDTNAAGAGLLINVTTSADAEVKKLLDTRNASNTGNTGWRRGSMSIPVRIANLQKIRTTGGVAGTIYNVTAVMRVV